MRKLFWFLLAIFVWSPGAGQNLRAQAVAVTVSLDANTIAEGGSTVLRVYAQVVPALREGADRIFSWYVDVLNSNQVVATASYDAMEKPTSDNDPLISSFGISLGADRRGIYDTFLNLPGAGTSNRVELMAIPVHGTIVGRTRLSVRAGTGVQGLAEDFIVAPTDGSDMWTGGDYSFAHADLAVVSSLCTNIHLGIQLEGSGSLGGTSLLRFTPCVGMNHTIEFRNSLESEQWQPLPGAPHNSGDVTVTNAFSRQFFRLRMDAQ